VKIDFQVMMIWLIAAILILVRKEEEKTDTSFSPTNDDIMRIICVFQQDQRVPHANMRFDPSNGKIIKNCADV